MSELQDNPQWHLTVTSILRYTGAELTAIMRGAFTRPVRHISSATHFELVDEQIGDIIRQKWTPCDPMDPGAVQKSWTEIDTDELAEQKLSLADLTSTIESTPELSVRMK
jgi:vacuolar protein-sorting-associated protein 4